MVRDPQPAAWYHPGCLWAFLGCAGVSLVIVVGLAIVAVVL